MKQFFYVKGDFIQNKKPYNGESERMIIDIKQKEKQYKCARKYGKKAKWDFENCELISFEDAQKYYKRVG